MLFLSAKRAAKLGRPGEIMMRFLEYSHGKLKLEL